MWWRRLYAWTVPLAKPLSQYGSGVGPRGNLGSIPVRRGGMGTQLKIVQQIYDGQNRAQADKIRKKCNKNKKFTTVVITRIRHDESWLSQTAVSCLWIRLARLGPILFSRNRSVNLRSTICIIFSNVPASPFRMYPRPLYTFLSFEIVLFHQLLALRFTKCSSLMVRMAECHSYDPHSWNCVVCLSLQKKTKRASE